MRTLLGGLVLLLAYASAACAQTNLVSVTIDSVRNKGCFDQVLFCFKPDMVVSVVLRQMDGVRISCPDTTPVVDFDNIAGLTSCTTRVVDGPVDVIISIADVDQFKLSPAPPPVQKIFNMAPQGSGATASEAVFAPFQTRTPVTYGGVDADISFTVTTTFVPPAFGNSAMTLSKSSFDPSLGETVMASNTLVMTPGVPAGTPSGQYPSTTPVTVVVIPSGGTPFTLVSGLTANKAFNVIWDGKINGVRAPNGIYTIQARLDSGGMASAPVLVTTAATAFDVWAPTMAGPVNPRAGPVGFPYRMSPQGTIVTRVEGPAAAGSACTAGALPTAVPARTLNRPAGSGVLDVELQGQNGIFIPSGNYCVRFQGTAAGGMSLGSVSREINVVNAPELRLVTRVTPTIPALVPSVTAPFPNVLIGPVLVPSRPVVVEAFALDPARRPRPTGTITVRAYPLMIVPIDPSLISETTCSNASSCRLTVRMETLVAGGGTATGTGNIAIEALAQDRPDASGATSPPASARVAPRGLATTRAGSMPIMVSVPLKGNPRTEGFTMTPRNQTLDVAFHAGTGIDLAVAPQANLYQDFIGNALQVFFGGDPSVGDTMTMTPDGSGATAFWMSATPAKVTIATSSNPANLCNRQSVTKVPFAEIQAVVHAVACRDNADGDGATFSAIIGGGDIGTAEILWHEFHHAAYDLADEYPPDGGYFQTAELPNVMRGPNECSLKGAEPAQCVQIGTTGWWRSGPTPDVMVGRTKENLDDQRRATFIINQCKGGLC